MNKNKFMSSEEISMKIGDFKNYEDVESKTDEITEANNPEKVQEYMIQTAQEYEKLPTNGDVLIVANSCIPSLCKYDLISYTEIDSEGIGYIFDCEERLLKKIASLTYKDNTFLELAKTSTWALNFLLKCIENLDMKIILDDINTIYKITPYPILKDMFYTMSVVINPVTFISILCELYFKHISFVWDEGGYCSYAIFNSIFRKESIEKMFLQIILKDAPYTLLTEQNQEVSYHMFQAMIELNSHPELLCKFPKTDEIFDVDKYIEKARTWRYGEVFENNLAYNFPLDASI